MNKVIFLLSILVSSIVCADLVKLSDEGKKLNIDDSEWSCVLDEDSSLVWEVKKDKEGIQYMMNTHTWFDGETGEESGKYSRNCFWNKDCNTKSYISAINKQQFCSFNDWRLPTRNELETLLNYYGESDILIDLRFFPNTQNTTYWTSVSLENNPSLAYEVPFFFGGSIVRDKSIDTHIRLVRSAD
ncbi:MAG: DUF1566 domain-containing protein [Candidatus Thioglobus sp.]|jgi:hypothetical protein|nr:DUF1566 domain-containing protein [Candidatus Thioglobus sp.]|tara:strand:+ start:171 stop:728 length:558 start_codon:yes stop_codon:yes gene_type:complete